MMPNQDLSFCDRKSLSTRIRVDGVHIRLKQGTVKTLVGGGVQNGEEHCGPT